MGDIFICVDRQTWEDGQKLMQTLSVEVNVDGMNRCKEKVDAHELRYCDQLSLVAKKVVVKVEGREHKSVFYRKIRTKTVV